MDKDQTEEPKEETPTDEESPVSAELEAKIEAYEMDAYLTWLFAGN